MLKQNWFDKHLSVINRILLLVIVCINLYVVATPFLPQLTYRVRQAVTEEQQVDTPEQRQAIDRSFDHVVIPRIGLDEKIWVGSNEKLVNKGIWKVDHTSTPDQGSNTVLVGHRFSYKDAAVLYHIDKIQIGDPIVVAWSGKLYTYRVKETKIVKPTDVYVEGATEVETLTVYSCHPLWSTRERLVVVSELEAVE